jgi:hypothetical protein
MSDQQPFGTWQQAEREPSRWLLVAMLLAIVDVFGGFVLYHAAIGSWTVLPHTVPDAPRPALVRTDHRHHRARADRPARDPGQSMPVDANS